jgi:hypothetical protein
MASIFSIIGLFISQYLNLFDFDRSEYSLINN